MPSFDFVSEVDLHELNNAVDQANREVNTRFDFKGTDSKFHVTESEVVLESGSEFQLQQMMDIFHKKMVQRGLDIGSLEEKDPQITGKRAKQVVLVRQGIDKDLARKIVKLIKDSKLKVQSAIQGEQVRVTGKKRDDLQQIIGMIKESKLGLPIQTTNFRD
ncbi:MAG: YajQ family cyclic di-GMP-binding protein [Gammaproteobacteria bacterium]|nr:YajQ family cyclic di-GMP-binding protein [Gammaproteobacteria bacterium]MDH5801066.1 YajQ family cyclic di-GMP-binding protein [Gammaproteobacteria bacterium]